MISRALEASELPRPSKDQTEWPWEVAPSGPVEIPGELPLISIVTPSFNQGMFLEETIRSVLLQGYPRLQYIVIDGGSIDESLSILRKYDPWLSHWVSEPDRGQPDALNKGLKLAHGSLFGFLNSDDLLMPGALWKVAVAHVNHSNDLVGGDVLEFAGPKRQIIQRVTQSGLVFEEFVQVWNEPQWHQPGVFFPRGLFDVIGPFDEKQQFGFDYEIMCRALQHAGVRFVDGPIAMFRLHNESKTRSNNVLQVREQLQSSKRFWHALANVDHAGYRKYAAEHLFCGGCSRLVRSRALGGRLALEGLAAHPYYALKSAVRQFPKWIVRRLRGNSAKDVHP